MLDVAIPFSSGLCSFNNRHTTSIAAQRRNPFFIRSVFVQTVPAECLQAGFVAIPFSSGLCSFLRGLRRSS